MTETKASDHQAVADKFAITEAIARSSHGLDRCNVEVLKSAYWPDATVTYGIFEGGAWDFAEAVMAGLREYAATQHQLSNTLVELTGPAGAKAETYCTAYHYKASDHTEMIVGGRYIDRMEKRDDVWRIAHRLYVMDWNQNGPASAEWERGIYAQLKTRGGRYPDDPYYTAD